MWRSRRKRKRIRRLGDSSNLMQVTSFFSHLSSWCVSINTYNKFIISHTHHIQYNAN